MRPICSANNKDLGRNTDLIAPTFLPLSTEYVGAIPKPCGFIEIFPGQIASI